MKHALLLFFGLIVSAVALGQLTWTQRLNYSDRSPYLNEDSITGIKDIEIGKDGALYILANLDQDMKESIFKMSPDDSVIEWSIWSGALSGLTGSYTKNIYPTVDSGCVISYNFWGEESYFRTDGQFIKYSKDGTLEWSHQFSSHTQDDGSPPYYQMEAYYVLQNEFYGNYYVFVGDSIYELNGSGNIVSKIDTVSMIYTKPNGDLILQTAHGIYCTDTAGHVNWSSPGDTVLASFPSYILATNGLSSQKINSTNGSIMWSIPSWSIPFSAVSSIEYTPDGGIIGSCGYYPGDIYSAGGSQFPGTIFKLDSSGSVIWSKTYNFPHYGLSYVKQLPSGNIITGGAYIFTNYMHEMMKRDYSAFVASLDSAGNGPLQSTTLMWPGDANNNQFFSFVDDALYVMVAMGDRGPKRDTLDAQYHCPNMDCGDWSDYGSDWASSFGNGTNHKYADFNGDGVIDTNDFALYSHTYPIDFNIPAWRKSNPLNHFASSPDFKLVAQRDTIAPGDSINFLILAGSAAAPVDSIYGLSFSIDGYYLSDNSCVREPTVTFKNSKLGTFGMNLYSYSNFGYAGNCISNNALISRTDHNNVYNLYDTIGIITLYSDTTHLRDSLILSILEFNALTAGGFTVSLNYNNGSVFVYNELTAEDELNKEYLKIYPNPANHILTVSSSTLSKKKIIVYNYLGQMIEELESSDAAIGLKTDELANGIYQLLVVSDGWSKNVAFVVAH